mgnify:FL=1
MITPRTTGERVCAFIETFCRCPEGRLVGKLMVLAPFQRKFILEIYDNPHTTSTALLSIARKNGKTALIASILLAHICGPVAKQNSQIISGAMSREQASLVFKLAVKMINFDQRLIAATRVVASSKQIFGLALNVEYKAISAEATTAHGLSPVLAILDEVGQIVGPTSPFVEAITSAQGAHEHPLLIAISTSAASDADMFSLWIDDALRSDDKHIVCHEYTASKDCDLLARDEWLKANPGMGIFRSEEDLVKQLTKASRLPALEASARNLLLNQRVSLESLWLAPSVWKSCNREPELEAFRQNPVAMGLDLSARVDLTAAVLACSDDNGDVHLLPYVFTPVSGIEEREGRDRAPYSLWVKQGFLIGVPGSTIDYTWVADFLEGELQRIGVSITTVCFDRWRITLFKQACESRSWADGATWVEVGQGYKDMSPRVTSFEASLLSGRIRHGGQPL